MEEWNEPKQLSDGSKICQSGSATLLQKFPLPHPLPSLSPSSAHARGTQKCPHGIISGRENPTSGGFPPSLGNISYGIHPHSPAEQRKSQILAQHHLPNTPELRGWIPTVAPMELMEQDTSHSHSCQSHVLQNTQPHVLPWQDAP